MLKNATFLSFYFADIQLFSNSETLVKKFKNNRMNRTFFIILFIYLKEKTRINHNEIKINGKTRKRINYKN
jgi:hypothetical protein